MRCFAASRGAEFAPEKQDLSLTGSAVGMGTAAYITPEQRLDATTIDARSDIFALGVVIYEMLAGNVPTGDFPPPTSKFPRRNRRLDNAVLRAMVPDREDHLSDAREISDALIHRKAVS